MPAGADKTAADIIVEALKHRHKTRVWSCLAYVVMPDHVHFVVQLLGGNLSGQVASFSKFTSREINRLLSRRGALWQPGFYDHALRGEKSLGAYLGYIMSNPVRAALAVRAEDWPYSASMPNW